MAMSEFPYQDAGLAVDERVADLLDRMTLDEKAGQLFHTLLRPGPDGTLAGGDPTRWGLADTRDLLDQKHMSHFNLIGPVVDAKMVATWHNNIQGHVLAHTRLGVPVTLSTDPRNHVDNSSNNNNNNSNNNNNVGTGFRAGIMSQWPGSLGLAALRDPGLARRFANVVRREYLALGLRVALHPQADVMTEYRWARVGSTFGEDAGLVSDLTVACIRGLQGEERAGVESVSTVTKHFPGAGPEMEGEDSHFTYGKEQVYPGGKFEYHLEPFRKAIEAGTRQIMVSSILSHLDYFFFFFSVRDQVADGGPGQPSYAMPVGTKYEQVGFGFNKAIITGLLREELGFDGIVLTDWGLITDGVIAGQEMPARAWGCEHLSEVERLVKILDAGCDQVGGEVRPDLVIQAVQEGLVSESRINQSVRRILKEKFVLGLFDDKRFVDVDKAGEIVGHPEFVALGRTCQREAFTILTSHGCIFPLPPSYNDKSFYIEGLDTDSLIQRGIRVVSDPAEADVALLRLKAPYEARSGGFEQRFHAGSLEFPTEEATRIAKIINTSPRSIIDVYLDRPAVLTPIVEAQTRALAQNSKGRGSVLMVNYGSDADAFLDVCFGIGDSIPRGKLPFDLPRSMEAASSSREDVPFDTKDPLFKFGHGLTFPSRN